MADVAAYYDPNSLLKWYQAQQADINKAKQSSADALTARANDNIRQINEKRTVYQKQNEDAAKQAYISRQVAQRDLPQRMAAMGNSGGLSESSLVALQNQYENQRNAYETQYQEQLSGLDSQVSSVNANLAAALAENEADYAGQLGSARDNYQQLLYQMEAAIAQKKAEEEAEAKAAAEAAAAAARASASRKTAGTSTAGAAYTPKKTSSSSNYTAGVEDQKRYDSMQRTQNAEVMRRELASMSSAQAAKYIQQNEAAGAISSVQANSLRKKFVR